MSARATVRAHRGPARQTAGMRARRGKSAGAGHAGDREDTACSLHPLELRTEELTLADIVRVNVVSRSREARRVSTAAACDLLSAEFRHAGVSLSDFAAQPRLRMTLQ